MLRLIWMEYRKLLSFRSVHLAALTCAVLPWIWSVAPRLGEVYGLHLISGWQLPGLTLITGLDYLLPILVAVTTAELLTHEVAGGTLAPTLLRPVSRTRLMLVKLTVALTYPAGLLGTLLLASLLAGLRLGLGDFTGGTGLGAGSWAGVGVTLPADALAEITRAYLLAALTLMPVAALAMLFAVIHLSTSAAALATISTLLLMRLLIAFPDALQKLLLTSHLTAYLPQAAAQQVQSLVLLGIYTAGLSLLAIFTFERKDV
ncbi:ABC transporter permease [Deinococcus soli (ex Cha et al. 2016)]|uniref:ABC-2 type transport system permease protein n=2 Tax=Deinococcus soli (ex Cha et al. 2016) TaxID=1309411 RepID=A0AAE4BNJ7_9DEIO|nr:ABC transporter permease [Deinococcus soli (ex Cha et al. 2016)]MDR6218781.1 ABC-2 type transport system permease protein [Deinococcus soli (ex Cha et al. 2016)]MDR6328578.1 ABC-2 type transport system permease protein [Deinococcus soli (ex Cha et al. 2016)]MDR6751935.1 ABC-2 type transport system permease protein [Deinococcus soli (ex Cha et al. 2016)]